MIPIYGKGFINKGSTLVACPPHNLGPRGNLGFRGLEFGFRVAGFRI